LLSNTFPLKCANYALDDSPIAAEALDLLDTRFKAIPSLKEIIVNIYVYGEEDLSDDLMEEMRDCGWTVEVTKLPKKVWICHEAGLEFDNKEDYEEYMNHELLLDLQREQEEEEEWWREEYYRRRRDPYWKNDSGLRLNRLVAFLPEDTFRKISLMGSTSLRARGPHGAAVLVPRGSTSLRARSPHGAAVLMGSASLGAQPPYALAVLTALQSSWAPDLESHRSKHPTK